MKNKRRKCNVSTLIIHTHITPMKNITKMAVGNFTSTNSSQQLMNADTESVNALGSVMSSIDGDDVNGDDTKRPSSRNSHQYDGLSSITYGEWFSVGVLCFVNLINYMDRFTIAGKSYKLFS